MNLSPSEQLAFNTVRIQATLSDGSVSTGTGFFFQFPLSVGNNVPLVLTNKHVIADAQVVTFHLTRAENGRPLVGQYFPVELRNLNKLVVNHPDADVDLCALLVASILNQAEQRGTPVFYRPIFPDLIASPKDMADLSALEEIVMVGYPIGLWDSVNNMPVFRKGVTASHPYMNYEDRKEFLADIPCFPGSSGSPVLLFNSGAYSTNQGETILGSRIKLLGVLFAGPQFTVEGQLQLVPVPTSTAPVPGSRIPVNLGVVLKAERILELQSVVSQLAEAQAGS